MKFISLRNHQGKRQKVLEEMKSFYSKILNEEMLQFYNILLLIPPSTEF